jgi:hypothetical protein
VDEYAKFAGPPTPLLSERVVKLGVNVSAPLKLTSRVA